MFRPRNIDLGPCAEEAIGMEGRRNRWGCGFPIAVTILVIFWVWGTPFGLAYWLDSERSVVAIIRSPDGSTRAQVEHIVMGGAPLTVVTVRKWWEPNTSLNLCRLATYYADVPLSIRWRGAAQVEVAAGAAAERHRIEDRKCGSVSPFFSPSGPN